MKKLILSAALAVACLFGGNTKASAQEFTVKADLVSGYVWRGMYQTGASIQPTLAFGYKGLSLTAWGSTDFDGTASSGGTAAKEIDLTLAWAPTSWLGISVADLWWAGQGAGKYFNFKSHETAHHFEGAVTLTSPLEKFPLSFAWNIMFAGMDKDAVTGDQNYSSYAEFNYPFKVKCVDLNATLGFVPYEAVNQYGNTGFAVTNVALKGSTALKITDSFSLPLFVQGIWNPRAEDAHLVFGVSLSL